MAQEKKVFKLCIGGEYLDAESRETYDIINPANGEVIGKAPKGGPEDARKAIDAAREAFDSGKWSALTPGERSVILWHMADMIESEIDRLASLETMNQGKTIKQARDSDLPFAVDNLRFFAGAARALEGKAATEYVSAGTSIIRREPVGVVGCITPWNYPLMMAIWKIGPSLAAGNTVIIKPATVTPLTTLELGRIAEKSGVPPGVINIVTGPGNTVGQEIVTSHKVDMVSLTGDTATGKKLMQLASSNVKKLHLELGGKAPFIVFDDADANAAVEGAVVGGFVNGGQDCTAATRIYLHEKIHDDFVEKLVSKTKQIMIGDPLDRKTDLGPLVSQPHRDKVESYIKAGIEEGAKLELGGKRPAGAEFDKGFFIEPTVFTNAQHHMKVCREEIFGPVLTVYKFESLDEVLDKANDVVYGLAASVWTTNIHKAFQVANRLRFGDVWINDHLPLTSEMPHGGYKQSGSGKDLSMYALEEFTQVKHVYVDLTGDQRKAWHYTVYGPPPEPS